MTSAVSPPGTPPPATPPPSEPATDRCPLCGADLAAGQQWCLECGAAARTRLAPPQRWRAPLLAALVVIVLAFGVLVAALVKLSGGSGTATVILPPSTATVSVAPPAGATGPAATGATASAPAAPAAAAGATGATITVPSTTPPAATGPTPAATGGTSAPAAGAPASAARGATGTTAH